MSGKIIDILKKAKKPLCSFELIPPLRGHNINYIYKILDPLMEFKPPYINVTYHREEVIYKEVENNLLEKRTVWKRPGTVAISAAIKNKYKVKVVPHLICGGFSKEDTEDALIDLNFLGINNILAVRGDPIKGSKTFVPEKNGHRYTLDLLKQIIDMNKGIYLDEDLKYTTSTNFSVGVAGYPEKHPEAPNMKSDLYFLKKKIDAGAEFIVTQMFFDNNKYFEFVKMCRGLGINVPIIPGIKPIANFNHLQYLPKTFSIDIPEELVKEVLNCNSNEDVSQVGIEWSIQQAKELIKKGEKIIHFYTMGKSDNILNILKSVF